MSKLKYINYQTSYQFSDIKCLANEQGPNSKKKKRTNFIFRDNSGSSLIKNHQLLLKPQIKAP